MCALKGLRNAKNGGRTARSAWSARGYAIHSMNGEADSYPLMRRPNGAGGLNPKLLRLCPCFGRRVSCSRALKAHA